MEFKKRRVVLPKTTCCFAQNDVSFFCDSLFPSRIAGKRHEKMPQQDVKTPLFSTLFAKHTFQSSGTNHKKRCISPPKWGKEGAFFPFSLIFRTNIEKK